MTFNRQILERSIATATAIMMIVMLGSCKKEENPAPHGLSWDYVPRDCKYLTVENRLVDSTLYHTLPKKELDELLAKGLNLAVVRHASEQTIKAGTFCMMLGVSSFTLEMLRETHKDSYDSDFISERDNLMEEAMEIEMRKKNRKTKSTGSVEPMMAIKFIEYRKKELKSLKVTSTSTLFGTAPETDLTSHFEIYGDESNSFLFNYKKELLGTLEEGMTVEEYLDVRPIVNPSLYLHLKDVPPETPMETKFIVEMEFSGGKILCDTTSVSLTR